MEVFIVYTTGGNRLGNGWITSCSSLRQWAAWFSVIKKTDGAVSMAFVYFPSMG